MLFARQAKTKVASTREVCGSGRGDDDHQQHHRRALILLSLDTTDQIDDNKRVLFGCFGASVGATPGPSSK